MNIGQTGRPFEDPINVGKRIPEGDICAPDEVYSRAAESSRYA